MLHELLLGLSGHKTSLFDAKDSSSSTVRSIDFPLLSPPEQALLQTIRRLSELHRETRHHSARISSSDVSTISRAVATSITTTHLARFQQKILDVESGILKRDAESVGAYNIVPLAGVVSEFDEWTRRLEWYWQLVCFILPLKTNSAPPCSGAALIDRLRQEAQTGYPDLEQVALELGQVAETAWLRQLSIWVLYGRLPLVGAVDFFIQKSDDNEHDQFEAVSRLLPKFVSRDTQTSILFIGKALNNIRVRGPVQDSRAIAQTVIEIDLLPTHLKYLANLAFPLSSPALADAISSIRLSLSRNTLQQLLPLTSILQILELLRDFFLLRRGEFAFSLVNEADTCLRTRNRNTKAPENLKGLLIKDAELTTILNKTFTTISSTTFEEDSSLDFARSLLRLHISRPATSIRPSTPGRVKAFENLPRLTSTTFNDFLLPRSVALSIDIPTPFDLFLTPAEISVYSSLQTYLLAIRRAHMRLCSLWRQSSLRRIHPSPLGPPESCKSTGLPQLERRRVRTNRRVRNMRATWATCSAAVFLLGEMSNYFEGEVIDEAWTHLRDWIMQDSESSSPGSAPPQEQAEKSAPHDPAMLSSSHRAFLRSLGQALLATNMSFTQALRDLLLNIESLVSLVMRIQGVWESLDLEEDEGVVDAMGNFIREEQDVQREIGRARKRVDMGLKEIVERLRGIDGEDAVEVEGLDVEGFVPLRGAGVERLLMRVDGQKRHTNEKAESDDGERD